MRKFKLLILLASISLSAYSQTAPDTTGTYSINDLYIDYAIPDISAFTMLGIAEDKIVRPGNVKQFSAELLNFLSSGNQIQTGFAAEFAPKNFNKKRDKNWWINDGIRWDNIAISLATATDDSLGTMFSGGLKFVMFDRSEAFGNKSFYDEVLLSTRKIYKSAKEKQQKDDLVYEAFIKAMSNNDIVKMISVIDSSFRFQKNQRFYTHRANLEEGKISNPIQYFSNKLLTACTNYGVNVSAIDSLKISNYSSQYVDLLKGVVALEAKAKAAILELKAIHKANNWYRGAAMLSTGVVGNSFEGTYDELDFRNFSFIASGAIGMPLKKYDKTNAQLILQAKYDAALIDTVEYDNKFSFGSRFIVGNADNRVSLEALYSSTALSEDFETAEYDHINYLKYVLGVELKVTKGTWIELAIGGQKFLEGKNETVIIPSFGFRHAVQSKRRYD